MLQKWRKIVGNIWEYTAKNIYITYVKYLTVLRIRFILIWIRIRIRGSVSDDYGSGSGSWPNLDKKSKFRNFLAFFWKEKFCGFPLSIKKRLKYSNPWTFRRNLAFSALHLLKFCSKMDNFWQIWLLDPDPDPLFFKPIRIRIRGKITDPKHWYIHNIRCGLCQINQKKILNKNANVWCTKMILYLIFFF